MAYPTEDKMCTSWLANRSLAFDSSGIRKVFDLAARMEHPINLSIGQPDFDVPEEVRQAYVEATQSGKNGYALTQGMPVLREKLQARIDREYGAGERETFVCSGTSGGLVLALLTLVNPGEEVIIFDPYFVMYTSLVKLVGGRPVLIDTYPDFRMDIDKVAAAITPQTKMIIANSPANPTGVCASVDELRDLAELAEKHNLVLVSDEIYREFVYDQPFCSPAAFNSRTLVIDGFSKSHAMTGWRLGFVHGPPTVIEAMIKVQQYTFVCAPQPAQWAGAVAMDCNVQGHVDQYRERRDMLLEGLADHYEIAKPGGAFYLFPKAPWGTATEFVERAIANNLLVIPGGIFSQRDTHFRISYAASPETLQRGIQVLQQMAAP
jgi:aspartate aminotransferase/aminotransferase